MSFKPVTSQMKKQKAQRGSGPVTRHVCVLRLSFGLGGSQYPHLPGNRNICFDFKENLEASHCIG